MVSPLWIAADSGDVDQVRVLLTDPSSVDIEIKGMSFVIRGSFEKLLIFFLQSNR